MKKTIVLTGATSGIGKTLLQKLSKQDCTIFAGYRNSDYKQEIETLSAIPFYIDLTDENSINEASKFICEKTDKIDSIINIAGCVVAGAMEDLPIKKVKTQFQVNTFSHLEFSQKLLPKMQEGKIINISSMASFGIFPFIAPYCASKRALDILFNALNLEQDKIKVISIKPGVIKTPLWDKSIKLNEENLVENNKYKKEFEYLKKNAEKNNYEGLDVEQVADLILQIEKCKKPKTSYTIGFDAKMSELFSKLPQDLQNIVVKKILKRRIDNGK